MRLKFALTGLLVSLTLVPLVLFWIWPHSAVLQNEFDEVEERHLLLARNLGAALQRYHRDLVATFRFISQTVQSGTEMETDEILANLEFRHICLFDPKTAMLASEASPESKRCPDKMPDRIKQKFQTIKPIGDVHFSEVIGLDDGENVIYLLEKHHDYLAVGAISTRYIVDLGKQISFGTAGHAAIVDQAGNVLSHPLDSWTAERKNIAGVSAVQRMHAGETGIDLFYSPAYQADMIAGFTHVAPVGWGVMIPQPVEELKLKAREADNSALTIMLLGLIASAIVALFVSFWVARPLERMTQASRRMASGHWIEIEPGSAARFLPVEFVELHQIFNKMASNLRASMVQIHELAYIDTVTNLANREYFKQRLQLYLHHQPSRSLGGAVVFLDLDGFKPVNDVFGHDGGDQLLKSVAERLADILEISSIIAFNDRNPVDEPVDNPPEILAARLGGDEFVLTLPGKLDPAELNEAIGRILAIFDQPFVVKDQQITLGASIGAACYPDHGIDYSTLLKKADTAMYAAKRKGKNRAVIYDESMATVCETAIV